MDTMDIICISRGTIHQGLIGQNNQCVANGACAIAFSVLINKRFMSMIQINHLLRCGTELYNRVRSERNITENFLAPDELLPRFNLLGRNANISVNWEWSGLYPMNHDQLPTYIQNLSIKIDELLMNSSENSGFLFTGLNVTVSFWWDHTFIYFFDPHAVNAEGVHSMNESENAARLFKFNDARSLSKFLLNKAPFDQNEHQFEINKITVHQESHSNNFNSLTIRTDSWSSLDSYNKTHPLPKKSSSSEDSIPLNIRLKNKRKITTPVNVISSNSGQYSPPSKIMKSLNIDKTDSWSSLDTVPLNKLFNTKIDNKGNSSSEDSIPLQTRLAKKALGSTLIIAHSSSSDDSIPLAKLIKKSVNDKSSDSDDSIPLDKRLLKDKLHSISENSSKKKPGRPLVKNRGLPKQWTKTKLKSIHTSQSKYYKANPEIIKKKQKKYDITNPNMYNISQKKYAKNNPEAIVSANTNYNKEVRSVPVPLRNRGLIGTLTGKDFELINKYILKNTCLRTSVTYKCPHCQAPLFDEEKSRSKWCCGEGINIKPDIPPVHESFYINPQFLKNARAFNNLFAFSALGVSHGFQHPNAGIAFVKIQGRIYHRVFDLSYNTTTNPIGMYIDDGEERNRIAAERNLDQNIVDQISGFLNRVNPIIPLFRTLNEIEAENAFIMFENASRRTHGNVLGDVPRGCEVAAFICTENESYRPKSIAIWKIGQQRPHTVDIFHQLYETFQYPLLYPHGTEGWHVGMTNNAGNKLSQVKYYRRLLLAESRFSETGRLSEEWLVDMYCRVEEERLRFISSSQRNINNPLRLATLNDIVRDETIQGEGGVAPGRVYLPNSFTGSARYMKTKYMDGMAIVNRLGKPSFFLTVTCNPNWPELKNSAPSGQRASSVLCARVFQLKLLEILRDIRNGSWFGKKSYILHVIEFQKRGLPHAHICFRIEGGGPIQCRDIDLFVRADIPSEEEASGRLRTLVLQHMIHGPCGPGHRTDLPCWDEKSFKCSKHFPKVPSEVTYVDDKGFVHYRRDGNNTAYISYNNRQVQVNDCWVVAYNASFLLKYECHANLEIASTRKIVKYLFKYISKGADYARVALVPEEQRNDETEQYATQRYIGACDSAWRMLEFEITGREPTVTQLPVHLDGFQFVIFRQNNREEATERSSSKLILYFDRPEGVEFDNLTYCDFYENYNIHNNRPRSSGNIFETKTGRHFVTKRQRGNMVARMIWVAPSRGEQFYLRLLLGVVPARGYRDLLNQGGEGCETFQAAARALGLANDTDEYHAALEEASGFMLGTRLRRFFILLIVNGAPAALLWNAFKTTICEDLLERFNGNEERAFTTALIQIDRQLRRHGTTLVELGLPSVEDDSTELGRERMRYDGSISDRFVDAWEPLLSGEQKELFNYVLLLLHQDAQTPSLQRAIFVDGPAGTGKTLVLKFITAYLRSRKLVVLCCASSGIAAQNHDGGFTAHSLFRLPLDIPDETMFWNLSNTSQRAELIREAAVIIYDEAPMAHKRIVHLLDRSLRDLMGCQEPFGGKIIIFAGDFRQIAPVVVNARNPRDVIYSSMRTSHLWDQLRKFSLCQAQRTREDEEYSTFLLNMGNGNLPSRLVGVGNNMDSLVAVPGVPFVTELVDLINFVFPNDILSDPEICANRSVLSIHNTNVASINLEILNNVPGDIIHLYSADTVDEEAADEFLLGADALHQVQAKGVPDHDLVLKIGAVCMVTRNLSFEDRLVNGTKVIIVNTSPRIVSVRKPGETDIHCIPRITFKMPVETGSPLDMCRRQFPLQLAYAMTVNKSQGQTIDRVAIDLRSDSFTHGQTYVAFGRVRSSSSLKILIDKDRVIDGVPYVKNVVYRELLPDE